MTGDERERLIRLKSNLERRALIHEHIRAFFREQGFLEVETPFRMPEIAPEPQITPLESENWFLSTSPELHMKRMLSAGYEKLFQIGRCFRKGERGRWHNPEFTMLEWYRVGADYLQIIQDTERLVISVADRLELGMSIPYQGHQIDLSLPWPRITVREAFLRAAGWDPVEIIDPLRFDTDLVTKVIHGFPSGRPTVIMDYPAEMAALSRLKPGQAQVAERAEIFFGGLELSNIYSELVDAQEQESRFKKALEDIRLEKNKQMPVPQRFLKSVPHLPECGGVALGVDRLVMLFCDAASIDEVMPFTSDTA